MVDDAPQEKTVNLTVPRKVHLGEPFGISGNLVHPKSGVGYVTLFVQARQNGEKWENIGETVTGMDGRFKSNLIAPTKKGKYELKAVVPRSRLYIGGEYDAQTITVGNPNPDSGSDKTLLDTFYKWVPIVGLASVGIAMVGLATYRPKNKHGGSEKKS